MTAAAAAAACDVQQWVTVLTDDGHEESESSAVDRRVHRGEISSSTSADQGLESERKHAAVSGGVAVSVEERMLGWIVDHSEKIVLIWLNTAVCDQRDQLRLQCAVACKREGHEDVCLRCCLCVAEADDNIRRIRIVVILVMSGSLD